MYGFREIESKKLFVYATTLEAAVQELWFATNDRDKYELVTYEMKQKTDPKLFKNTTKLRELWEYFRN